MLGYALGDDSEPVGENPWIFICKCLDGGVQIYTEKNNTEIKGDTETVSSPTKELTMTHCSSAHNHSHSSPVIPFH